MSPQTVYAYIFVYRSNNIHAVVYAFIIITVQETKTYIITRDIEMSLIITHEYYCYCVSFDIIFFQSSFKIKIIFMNIHQRLTLYFHYG